MTGRTTTIRTKLGAVLGVALLIVVGLGAFSMTQLDAVHRVTQELHNLWTPKIRALDAMQRAATSHRLLAIRRMETTNFRHLAALGSGLRTAEDSLGDARERFRALPRNREETALLVAFDEAWAGYETSFEAVADRLDGGEITSAARAFHTQTLPAFDAATLELDRLTAAADRHAREAEEKAAGVQQKARLLIGAAIMLAVGLAVGAILWASAEITSPLLRVSRAMQRLTAGYHAPLELGGEARRDEIGVLMRAAEGYRESLIRSREFADQAAIERRRLDVAINTMPIGLSMYDAKQRLIVCNDRYAEIYGLPAALRRPGAAFEDILAHLRSAGFFDDLDLEGFVRSLSLPLAERQAFVGAVDLRDGRAISITYSPMPAGGWVSTHEDVTARRKADAQIRHMARHDALTELPNRVQYMEALECALQGERAAELAVLSLDLDRFKIVNDTLGHGVGDELLRAVAGRLRAAVRAGDVAARFGGDEFVVLQRAGRRPEGVAALAERLIEALSRPYRIGDHQLVIGASVGIALASEVGIDANRLLKCADMALYRAKSDGRGAYCFFAPEMDAEMQSRRRMELDLRAAHEEGEFRLHYQPILDLKTNRIVCFEALMRWRHESRGLVSPAAFIPLAEEIGLIGPMGRWALRRACRDAAAWPAQIAVSVNLSPSQVAMEGLAAVVQAALAESGLAPERLELEITENALLAETEATLTTLRRLRALGVRIVMDDFGAGYSGVGYLRSFEFDKVKIDRSFVLRMAEDKRSMAVFRAVTSLGADLGIVTAAEGVETAEQLERVRGEGCDEAQGYYFSSARPADEAAALIERFNGPATQGGVERRLSVLPGGRLSGSDAALGG